MNKVEILKTIAGILILMFSVTILLMAFSNNGLKALMVLFNFNLDINASNLGEAIATAFLGLTATLFFLVAMIFIGIVYLAICINFGVLTLVLKTNKAVTIIVLIFTTLSMVLEIRALAILARAELTSGILIAHLFADIVVAGISVYSIIILYGFPEQVIEIAPKTTSSTKTEVEITGKPQISKFCPYCGMELKLKNKFCTNCGKSLTNSA
ncbi:MAG: zinc ribbon domain-containing protein [Candidatus Hodarchaeota archaeon]